MGVAAELVRAVTENKCSVEPFLNEDTAARQGGTPRRRFDLQDQVRHPYGVVVADSAFVMDRKDATQIEITDGQKGRPWLSRGNRETGIEFCDVLLPKKGIGGLEVGNAAQPQLLRQTSLPSAKATFTAATC